jgi:uncharacterized protein YecE (DUF72 family)
MQHQVMIGTAGWSIPPHLIEAFPGTGTHLERYARQLPATEINSSFYRPHRPSTFARWARCVPSNFRFSVKIPKEITHVRRLVDADEPLQRFLTEVQFLGDRLGPLLIQLPPSLAFDAAVVERFAALLRKSTDINLVCEPRHPTWFTDAADLLLSAYRIARVAADPAVVPRAAEPGGWSRLAYWRLHGSPRMYYSAYPQAALEAISREMVASLSDAIECWCIFDNTASGEASSDALSLLGLVPGVFGSAPHVALS